MEDAAQNNHVAARPANLENPPPRAAAEPARNPRRQGERGNNAEGRAVNPDNPPLRAAGVAVGNPRRRGENFPRVRRGGINSTNFSYLNETSPL